VYPLWTQGKENNKENVPVLCEMTPCMLICRN